MEDSLIGVVFTLAVVAVAIIVVVHMFAIMDMNRYANETISAQCQEENLTGFQLVPYLGGEVVVNCTAVVEGRILIYSDACATNGLT